jgi:5-formyltetrahydrofolate cyclo-ligase
MAARLVAAKKELRKKMREILNSLSEAAAASQSMRHSTNRLCQGSRLVASNATKILLSMPEYKAARRISVYLSMPGGEISTTNIVRDALDQGKKVFIPYTYTKTNPEEGQPRSIMDMVELQSMSDFESLAVDKWGIPTPSEHSISSRVNCFGGTGITNGDTNDVAEGLDLIVMPGMAFDASFGRLGHGKGFYDYFLTRCHQASRMPFRGENYWYYICGGLTNHVKLVYH